MKMTTGCDILRDRLTGLLAQATAVRRSLATVDANRVDAHDDSTVSEAFGDMAVVVADMLGDVNSRLGRLDDVLQEIHRQVNQQYLGRED
jgi:hypothetical protein